AMPSSLLGESEQSPLSGKHLWVIDDNPVNRQFLVHNGEQWGITVTAFERAEIALVCLERDRPTVDAMVVDWQLPGMTGLEFAEALERYPAYNQVPLVMLTATHTPSVAPLVANRFTAWLQNPIARETLHGVLTQILTPDGDNQETAAIASPPTLPGSTDANPAATPETPERSPQAQSSGPPAIAPTLEAGAAPGEETVSPLRILLAEDNPVNQKVALLMLDRLGYHADVVADGEEVLQALERTPYSVILMDLEMPQMDGLTAAKAIQKRYALADRPQIVALTAYAMDEDRDRCLAAGMDDYITKPIRKDALLEVLYRAEHRSRTQDAEGERVTLTPEMALAGGDANRTPDTSGVLSVPPAEAGGAEASLSEASLPEPPPFSMPSLDPLGEQKPDIAETQILWDLEEPEEPQLDLAVVEGLLSVGGASERAMAMVSKAVTLFCEDTVERLGVIEQALTTHDASALRRAAHALRSGSANLGANQLADYCNQLESLAREV
ncbi:MAG: response regulator, partial [Cyanobacteria bacterium P01_H01_bin.130]